MKIIDEKLSSLRSDINSIDKLNAALQADINANPLITQKTATISQSKLVVDGQIKTMSNPSVTTTQIVNPKPAILQGNTKIVENLRGQEQTWTQKKQTIEEDTRKECKASVGFLEELEAMWTIITTRKLAGAFYVVFFVLLMSLELFVVVSKLVDKECDYEAAIKGAQRVKIAQFSNAFSRVKMGPA